MNYVFFYPTKVEEILLTSDLSVYEKEMLDRALSEMSDVMPCPSPSCNNEYVWVRMDLNDGHCHICGHRFCPRCNAAAHRHGICPQLVQATKQEEGERFAYFSIGYLFNLRY